MATRKSQQNSAASVIDGYEVVDQIGKGSFGVIHKVKRRVDGKIFARKEMDFSRMSDRDRKQIVAEVNILRNLKHESIVAYEERFVAPEVQTLYIIMEYCGGGDLGEVIKKCRKANIYLPEETVWSYFSQMTQALEALHYKECDINDAVPSAPILHRDLKPENVFLDHEDNVKLGDFGLSKQVSAQAFTSTYVGTPYYMSPEIATGKPYDYKCDVWALGCIAYELCALAPPFDAQNQAELTRKIKQGHVPKLPRGYSADLGDLIRQLLSLNAKDRPTTRRILAHPHVRFAVRTRQLATMSRDLTAERKRLEAESRDLAEREAAIAQAEQVMEERRQHAGENAAAQLIAREQDVRAREELCRQSEEHTETVREQITVWYNEQVAELEKKHQAFEQHCQTELAAIERRRQEVESRSTARRSSTYAEASTQGEQPPPLPSTASVRISEHRAATYARPLAARRISAGGRSSAGAVGTSHLDDHSVDLIRAGVTGLGTPRAQRERQLRAREREERHGSAAASHSDARASSRRGQESEGSDEWVEEDAAAAVANLAISKSGERGRASQTGTSATSDPAPRSVEPRRESHVSSRAGRASASGARAAPPSAARMYTPRPSADTSDVSMRDASYFQPAFTPARRTRTSLFGPASASKANQTVTTHDEPSSDDMHTSGDGPDKENSVLCRGRPSSSLDKRSDLISIATRPVLNTRTTIATMQSNNEEQRESSVSAVQEEAISQSTSAVPTYNLPDDDPDLPSPFLRKVTRINEGRLSGRTGRASTSNKSNLVRAATNGAAKLAREREAAAAGAGAGAGAGAATGSASSNADGAAGPSSQASGMTRSRSTLDTSLAKPSPGRRYSGAAAAASPNMAEVDRGASIALPSAAPSGRIAARTHRSRLSTLPGGIGVTITPLQPGQAGIPAPVRRSFVPGVGAGGGSAARS